MHGPGKHAIIAVKPRDLQNGCTKPNSRARKLPFAPWPLTTTFLFRKNSGVTWPHGHWFMELFEKAVQLNVHPVCFCFGSFKILSGGLLGVGIRLWYLYYVITSSMGSKAATRWKWTRRSDLLALVYYCWLYETLSGGFWGVGIWISHSHYIIMPYMETTWATR